MTQIERAPMPTVPSPDRIGQGTSVEQSRAAAEVLAAVEIAQRFPRDVQYARAQMIDSCKQLSLANQAFYRFSRAGSTVTGPSVHLARELARCWGHVQYGLVELRRDDEYGQSEMQAWAWDVQTNARVSTTFIVPHKRDTKRGARELTDLRDVYENNANQGARRVREMIFAVLPPWFVEEAKALCEETLRNGGGVPLAQRITNAIEKFAEIGVSVEQLETKVGKPNGKWTEHDTAQLGVIYTSIRRGEVSKEAEFPSIVTPAEILAQARGQHRPADPDADAYEQAEAEGAQGGA